MSNRSLIEFNHDCWPKIASDREGFANAVLEMSRAGGTPQAVDHLERYGVTYVGQRHHSERATVEYPHYKVSL